MDGQLRPILPRQEASSSKRNAQQQPSLDFVIPKRHRAALACKTCRKRKLKCDGRQPLCSRCRDRNEACEYNIATDRSASPPSVDIPDDASELLERLRTLPLPHAVRLLKQFRDPEGESSSTSLLDETRMNTIPFLPSINLLQEETNTASTANVSVLPGVMPSHDVIRSHLPATRNKLEFELTVRHAVAYPTLYPLDVSLLPVVGITRPRIGSQLPISPSQLPPLLTPQHSSDSFSSSSSNAQDLLAMEQTIDPRLQHLQIRNWTSVDISNDLAGRIISLYLETDYTVLPLFQADLFLSDLIHCRTQFCSRPLVSALLSWACQTYSSIDPKASSLSVAFFLEAKTTLAKEMWENTITMVSALNLLSMTSVTQGQDSHASWYLQEGIRKGKSLHLFGVSSSLEFSDKWASSHEQWRKAASYTAWGGFNWVCVYGLHYQKAELAIPPLLPLPGESEINLASHTGGITSVDSSTLAFNALSKLFAIFNDVLQVYYGDMDARKQQAIPISFAEGIYHRLLTWANSLPLEMVRSENNKHFQTMPHIYFHAIVADLFRPFLRTDNQRIRLAAFTAEGASPDAAYAASINQLKRLLLLYRLRFPKATLSVLWQTGLIYVVNAVVREAGSNTAEWRYYLDFCLAGLQDLSASYRVFGSVAKGILAMAIEVGAMNVQQAKVITETIERLQERHASIDQLNDATAGAGFIVDLDLAVRVPEAARGIQLEENFTKLLAKDNARPRAP